jgi:hypothetical protein
MLESEVRLAAARAKGAAPPVGAVDHEDDEG